MQVSVVHKGTLENRKPMPRGNSYATDDELENQ